MLRSIDFATLWLYFSLSVFLLKCRILVVLLIGFSFLKEPVVLSMRVLRAIGVTDRGIVHGAEEEVLF
jgi:hypothetical protein